MPTLLVATTNRGKLAEITDILGDLPIELASLDRFPSIVEPDEHGTTFAQNARDKASYYARAGGLLTVAEDSGLAIDCLDGAPGVHSARFPGETYAEKFAGLYRLMDARGVDTSPARFVCALAVVEGQDLVFEASGIVEGIVIRHPRGEGGFGYDPIFFYPPLGCTLAELSAADKSAVSHRGRAFRELHTFLARRLLAS